MRFTVLALSAHVSKRPVSAGEAVFARCLSSLKEERVLASKSLTGPQGAKFTGDKAQFLEDIRKVGKARGLFLNIEAVSHKPQTEKLVINY